MRRLTIVLFFLVLVEEARAQYAAHIFAPFAWVEAVLLSPIAKVRPFDALMAAILVYSLFLGRRAAPLVRPMRNALYAAAGVTVVALIYGLLRGGAVAAAGWQAYLPLTTVLTTFTFAQVCRVPRHFIALWNALLAASVCHAVMCVLFHYLYIRPGLLTPMPEFLSTHDDTVLWVIGIGLLLLRTVIAPTAKNRVFAAILVPLLMAAIQFNRRRLAWISLGGELVIFYVLVPSSRAKTRASRIASIVGPCVGLYLAVGWNQTGGVFWPAKALRTVLTAEDNSTKARIVENLGLIATANQNWALLGTGWGHKYIEISSKYQIYFFDLWPYVPHNSVLGLLAYTGLVGFVGYWMLFPLAAFHHARLARTPDLDQRFVGIAGVMVLFTCAVQWFGDMGSFSVATMYALASSLAAATRLSVTSSPSVQSRVSNPRERRSP